MVSKELTLIYYNYLGEEMILYVDNAVLKRISNSLSN